MFSNQFPMKLNLFKLKTNLKFTYIVRFCDVFEFQEY